MGLHVKDFKRIGCRYPQDSVTPRCDNRRVLLVEFRLDQIYEKTSIPFDSNVRRLVVLFVTERNDWRNNNLLALQAERFLYRLGTSTLRDRFVLKGAASARLVGASLPSDARPRPPSSR